MNTDLENMELRSEEVKDILSHVPPRLIRWGSLLFLVLIVLVLALSWFIKYPDVIKSEAYLTTENPPQKEYAKISARIDTLWVTDKQQIRKNEILAILENSANNQDVYLLKSIMDTLTMTQEHIFFPFESLPILLLGDIEPSFTQFENSYFQYIVNRELQPFSNETLANKIALTELNGRLKSLVQQKATSNAELALKKGDLERNKLLFQKGIISKQNFENKEVEYLTALKNHQNMDVMLSQVREALNTGKRASKTIDYDSTREETQLLKKVLQAYNQLKKTVREWELKYAFKSNINGEVAFLKYWDTNQTVASGDLVFTISPLDNDFYIAKLKTQKTNVGKVQIGQRVNLKLFDYTEYEFGVIRGTVEKISTISDTEGTYSVDVFVPKDLTTSFGKKVEFKQEMKGEADIITEDLRLLERFFYQFREIYKR
ncbi:MAG TPA: HlyD family efflux transporter periplasmic adaptor subunit [Flavobacteriaceae bacterium]